jgi:hypothetical protein
LCPKNIPNALTGFGVNLTDTSNFVFTFFQLADPYTLYFISINPENDPNISILFMANRPAAKSKKSLI